MHAYNNNVQIWQVRHTFPTVTKHHLIGVHQQYPFCVSLMKAAPLPLLGSGSLCATLISRARTHSIISIIPDLGHSCVQFA